MKRSRTAISAVAIAAGSIAALALAGCSASSSSSDQTNSSDQNSSSASPSSQSSKPGSEGAAGASSPLAVETFAECQNWLDHDGNLTGTIKWPALTALNPREQAGGWVFNGTVATTKNEKLTFTCGLKKADGEWVVVVQKRSYAGNMAKPDNV